MKHGELEWVAWGADGERIRGMRGERREHLEARGARQKTAHVLVLPDIGRPRKEAHLRTGHWRQRRLHGGRQELDSDKAKTPLGAFAFTT